MNSRITSLKRANELADYTVLYQDFKHDIIKLEKERLAHYQTQKMRLLDYFNATETDWNNWHWQMKNRITEIDDLKPFLDLSDEEYQIIQKASKINRFAVVPYYLALIYEFRDPIYMLSIPTEDELDIKIHIDDPMAEEFTNPAGSITRRYPDRLIINVTNSCAMYCRHCQRRRLIKKEDYVIEKDVIDESIAYINDHPEIRDVLITGGDAFLLSDQQLDYILSKIRKIPHVEVIRLGTRTPVTMPMRITDNLVKILTKYHPLYVNTHFNHPFEITAESKKATEKLSNAGINVGNQAVLLNHVNNDPFIMRYLGQKLLTIRVRPYYLFHAKKVTGTSHFIPKIQDGLDIMAHLRGNTSGMAIPTYILNAPGGFGKIPLLPEYILEHKNNTYKIKTWEGRIIMYKESD